MDILLNPSKVTRFLAGVTLFLVLAHLAGLVSTFFLGHNHVFGLVPLFDMNTERNVPTLYAGLSLLFCAVLFGLVAWAKRGEKETIAWAGLALIFGFLFYDELVAIHEGLIETLQTAWNTTGFLKFAWVIPYGLGVVVLLLAALFAFFASPASGDPAGPAPAGFLYVGGALGFELLSGNQASVQGKDLTFELFVMAEEILEMSGVLILIYGLLSYIQTHLGGIRLIFGDPSPDRAGHPG